MTNPLIARRDAVAARHPETRLRLNGREWGLLDTGRAIGGSGRALLLLPGTLGRGDVFFNQIEALESDIRVLAVSYPTSGSLDAWIDDLETILALQGLTQVAVLGTSLGGYVAQMLAASRPNRVSHLFAANTLPSVRELAERRPFSLDLWNAPIAELRAGFGDTLVAWRAEHPEEADLIDLLLAEMNGRIPEAELRARMAVLKGAKELPPCPLPADAITLIDSADDPLIPPHWREQLRQQRGAGASFRFRQGGHFPYLARPSLYTDVVRFRLGLGPLPAAWGPGPDHEA